MRWIRAFITFIEDSIEALAFDVQEDRGQKRLEDRQKRWLKWLYDEPSK